MRSSTLVLLFAVFLFALSLSVSVVNAGEEKEEKKEEKVEGKEEKKEGKGEGEPKEGGEGEKKGDEGKSGATSFLNTNALSTAISIAIAGLFFSIH